MAFGGQLFIATDSLKPFTVTEAIVTAERIFVEWSTGELREHLEATSSDGVRYRGEYCPSNDGSPGTCELTLFKSPREYLLFGEWTDPDSTRHGVWTIRLQTDVVLPKKEVAPRSVSDLPPPREKKNPTVQVEMTRPSGAPLEARRLKSRAIQEPVATPTAIAKPELPSPAPTQKPVAAPNPIFSNQLDHLLNLTADEFANLDPTEIEATLEASPSSAVFKLSRSAAAPALKALAAAFIERHRSLPAAPAPQPLAEPLMDAKTLKAHRRRSSKHWK